MLKCDFNKVAFQLLFSCKFAAYFQNTFLLEHLWGDCFPSLLKLQGEIHSSLYTKTGCDRNSGSSGSFSDLLKTTISDGAFRLFCS